MYKGVECQDLEKDDLPIENDKPLCFGDMEIFIKCFRPCKFKKDCETKADKEGLFK